MESVDKNYILGILYTIEGEKYEGEWKDDLKNGKGRMNLYY